MSVKPRELNPREIEKMVKSLVMTATFKSNDTLFYQTKNKTVLGANSVATEIDTKDIMTDLNTNMIDIVPRCDCKKKPLRNFFNVGKTCTSCGVTLKDPHNIDFNPKLWFEALPGTKGFISPQFLLMCRKMLGTSSPITWIIDPTEKASKANQYWFDRFEKDIYSYNKNNDDVSIKPFVRSQDWLIEHLEEFFIYLSTSSKIKNTKKKQLASLLKIIRKYRDNLVSMHIPIINKNLLIKENTSMGKYTNIPVLSGTIDVVMSYINALKRYNNKSMSDKEKSKIMGSFVKKLAEVASFLHGDFVGQKPGLLRKNISGTRVAGARAVIVSIMGKHDYNDVHLPWRLSVVTFKPMLYNLLVNRKNYSPRKARDLIRYALLNYDEVIDDCFKTLIKEADDNDGMWIAMVRNPSLPIGSIQRCRVRLIKTEIDDLTIAMGMLMTKVQNADFDGDQETFIMMFDDIMRELSKTLDLSFSVPSETQSLTIGSALTLPDPCTTTIGAYINEPPTEDTTNNVGKLNIKVDYV